MRTFQYQDEKSSKFWNISLEDCTHTVNYGKSGTSGRTQSKSFETAEEAKKSYDKLIEQKIKKGYLEVETATEKIEESTEKTTIENQEKERKLNVVRSINLNPEDYLWATWKPRNPLPNQK